MEKTGSTAVQREFSVVRKKLLKGGLLYPGPGLKHPYVRYIGEHIGGRNIAEDRLRIVKRRFSAMADEWRSLKRANLLLSEETVSRSSLRSLAGARQALDPLSREIYCVVYVRHPLSHVVSIAAQNLKGRHRTMRDLEAAPPIPRIREKLTRMIEVFGRDKMIVRGYDASLLASKSVQHDLLDAVAYEGDRGFITGVRTNEALSLPAAMILSATTDRRAPRSGREGRLAHRERLKILAELPGPKFTLSRMVLKRTRDETAIDLGWLEEEFGIVLPEPVVRPLEETARDLTEEEAMAESVRMFPDI